ncbi:MAG: extradiol ring-cleavage dioxygenase [Dehalococcoidia bacterium]
MGEVLGLGVTHGPFVMYPAENMANILKRRLESPNVPDELKDPASWPEAMQKEWGDDEGLAAAHVHRETLIEGFRRTRARLDDFNPDLVIIWGDDQYENFHEEVVPAFCVYAHDEFQTQPFATGSALGRMSSNVWGEAADWTLKVPGSRKAGKELATHLIGDSIDVAWSYKPLHHGLGHAFWRTVAHLDYDRAGFNYPIIPFHVNCYGSKFTPAARQGPDAEPDPPGPNPSRCFEVGASIGRFFADSPYKVALIGSSSWSHAFLTPKFHGLWPDTESDKARYEELKAGNLEAWRNIPISQIEACGQQEMLNWMCLAGAMQELGKKPVHTEFVESYVFVSNKVVAHFD